METLDLILKLITPALAIVGVIYHFAKRNEKSDAMAESVDLLKDMLKENHNKIETQLELLKIDNARMDKELELLKLRVEMLERKSK